MHESSQSVARLAALIAVTALFVVVWGSDRSVPAVAVHPAPTRGGIVALPASVSNRSEKETRPAASSITPPEAAVLSSVVINGATKTFTVDGNALTLTPAQLSRHLDQLPLGLPAGDYRIVDALGGVAWLRVRCSSTARMESSVSPLLTTNVAGEDVRFIRVASGVAGRTEGVRR